MATSGGARSKSNGSRSNAQQLFLRVRDGPKAFVLKALEAAVEDPDMRYGTLKQNLMFFAAARKQTEGASQIARKLADIGVDATCSDGMKQTPLFYAAKEGNEDCASFLIERRCDVNHIDKNGQTAIFYSVREGHNEMIKVLISMKASMDVQDNQGKTPLAFAAANSHKNGGGAAAELSRILSTHPNPSGRKAESQPLSQAKAMKVMAALGRANRRPPIVEPTPVPSVPSDTAGGDSVASTSQPSTVEGESSKRRRVNGNGSVGRAVQALGMSDPEAAMHAWVYPEGQSALSRLALRRGGSVPPVTSEPLLKDLEVLEEVGEYLICVPHIAHAARLRELEREFVLDHHDLFADEPWHSALSPEEWCQIVNVLHEERRALQAIENIIRGFTNGHQTLQVVHRPDPNAESFSTSQIVGYVHVYRQGSNLDISHLKVERSHQRKGLGYLMLAGSVRRAEKLSWNVQALRLVAVSKNLPALTLYEKLSFERLDSPDKPESLEEGEVEWQKMGRSLQDSFRRLCVSKAKASMNRAASALSQ
ncbi:unnamed protein product [Polarella glacialis]|uniref:N-acetyltransferase domain-containing protein n=1 Tax=Polarella glacialis TaxID=89957 RepID=A0A813JPG4_POLGL|nr:unnamed protein product [Polarella glacialis]CAE8681147.1 unnamed protein product [Polarella glacialis]